MTIFSYRRLETEPNHWNPKKNLLCGCDCYRYLGFKLLKCYTRDLYG
jgi:hypothetical protein